MPDWAMVALRTLLAVVILFFMTKLLGKRQISQLSLFEYITGITIGSLAAYISMEMDAKWYLGIVSLAVWVAFSLGIEWLQIKSKKSRDFIDGTATTLIKDGQILEDNLKRERLTTDELMMQLRGRDVFRVADVEFALIETNGQINVLPKRDSQALTPQHLGIEVAPEQVPIAVIMDGKIMNEALSVRGLTQQWLQNKLAALELDAENVFLGQVDAYGQLYVDLYNDQIKAPIPQQKASLYATLKKCEADLELFALSVDDQKAKAMYTACSDRMQKLLVQVKPILHN